MTEQVELFALKLGKIAAFNFVYSLASTNIKQSAPNLVTMYMSIMSQMSLIMGQFIPDRSVLCALDIEKLNKVVFLVIIFIVKGGYCYVPTQLILVCTCVYLFLVSLWLFLELDFLLWNIVLEVSGPVSHLITRYYATYEKGKEKRERRRENFN